MHLTREAFMSFFRMSPAQLGMGLIYDVAHNIAKVENHIVDGRMRKLVVHRKGAARAFPAGHPELPEVYRSIGQPVIIPGDMGRASYLFVGAARSMSETFGSAGHGAGRVMSRNQAIKKAKGRAIWRELEDRGVIARASGRETLAEEMPEAYKDVAEVVNVIQNAGIAKKIARMRPMGVVKG
jgi:tRNA-splicing ligase RtcB